MAYGGRKFLAIHAEKFHVEHARYSPEFERFWSAFPRRQAKGRAWAAWQAEQPPIEAVLAALAWQINQPRWQKDGGTYVPYAATWITDRSWEDEPFHITVAEPDPAETKLGRKLAAIYGGKSGRD